MAVDAPPPPRAETIRFAILCELAVSSHQRTGGLFIFIGDARTCDVFGHEPDLKLIHAENVADQQVVGSIVATGAAARAAWRAASRTISWACKKRNI